ncbi:MAG: glucosamine-6-phosphate deaminase [Acidimicrobiaceae bacterium]|nr:glucosamine-6-phosphate deaminase [Acidimicrobiaceae bacterium]
MEVVITRDADAAAEVVASVVARAIRDRPAPVIGLATGSSPLGAYRRLIERYEAGELTAAHASAVLLDEYVGLPADHPEAYRAFIRREFVDLIDLPTERLFGPDVTSDDLPDACRRYDRLIADLGGVDVQLLGIGGDGHIGFNEPGSSLASRTRIKTLTDTTRSDNARFFEDDEYDVPRHVVTQGLGTILEARHLLMIATGDGKAEPIARAVEGPLAAMCPASVLQLHPHATVVVDDAAAAGLQLADYYREAYAHKPDWQSL